MISVEVALQLVLAQQKDFGVEEVDLLSATGRILAQPVFADRDFPPYDRVTMDGIALNASAYNAGIRSFEIEKMQAAGSPRQTLENNNHCIEVMTGAVLPINTDLVIPYEQCEIQERIATVTASQIVAMQHVHLQGTDGKKGELLLEKWARITPAMIGVMASVGLSRVQVVRLPKITICSTGDELIDLSQQPAPHQVRRSNVYMLAAALLAEGIHAATIHLPDNPEEMADQITPILHSNDVVLFSGAVSKGKFDFLPMVLDKLRMQLIFHTIAQRPGKPFLFGKFTTGPLIFGFPGNPVSTFVCYHQFFKKWLHQCLQYKHSKHFAALTSDVLFNPALSYHLLVKVENSEGIILATQVTGSSSGDLVSLCKADGILTLPADRNHFMKGEVFEMNLL